MRVFMRARGVLGRMVPHRCPDSDVNTYLDLAAEERESALGAALSAETIVVPRADGLVDVWMIWPIREPKR